MFPQEGDTPALIIVLDAGFPPKPLRMRWRTYEELQYKDNGQDAYFFLTLPISSAESTHSSLKPQAAHRYLVTLGELIKMDHTPILMMFPAP